MRRKPPFATEAELCAAFIAWVKRTAPEMRVYAEWEGWDILLAYPQGYQIGIQAKLRLNAEVVLQAAPDVWYEGLRGPDFRAVLVPTRNGLSAIAERFDLIVFHWRFDFRNEHDFMPPLEARPWINVPLRPSNWFDWNPKERLPLPPVDTDSIAGSPCPVTLTPWKLNALRVMAELNLQGSITAKRIRALGCDPGRWTQYWLDKGAARGEWIRSERLPNFEKQHPTAYAAALEAASAHRQEAPA